MTQAYIGHCKIQKLASDGSCNHAIAFYLNKPKEPIAIEMVKKLGIKDFIDKENSRDAYLLSKRLQGKVPCIGQRCPYYEHI